MRLRLGARGSALSLAQAALVRSALEAQGVEIDVTVVKTTGDRLSAAGSPIEWKGDFTRELDEALLGGRIDFAVHSLKDVPSELPQALALIAVPAREDPRDVLVSRDGVRFADLPRGARLGTSSPRRRAQILAARPDLEVVEARGNVDTRIRRMEEGRWDGIVLARAGLARLGRLDRVTEVFAEDVLLPAVGQGALALVSRGEDRAVAGVLQRLDDRPSHAEVLAERAVLRGLEAGCRAPVAARAVAADGNLRLSAGVFSADGRRVLRESAGGSRTDPAAIGRVLAERLLSRGAASLMAESER